MLQGAGLIVGFDSLNIWLAQANPAETALVLSGPRFFIALISGVVLAFAFQLLLTNLSVALGISILGGSSDSDSSSNSSSSDSSGGGFGSTIRKIGFGVGLWTLVTVTIALFFACLLAVNLSLLQADPGLGAILGLVIWATYFSLLVWVSSTTVGSLIGSVVNTATSGFQAIVGTAAAAIGGKAVNSQVVSTAEAAAAAVRRELTSAIDPTSIRESVEDYLETIRPGDLDIARIRQEFEGLLNDPELKSIAASGDLGQIDRQTFVDLVSRRTDFSKRDLSRISDQLYTVWQQVTGSRQRDVNAELLDYLKSAHPDELKSEQLTQKLDQLIEETRQQRVSTQDAAQKSSGGLMDRAVQFGMSTLMGSVMGRADLSDLDVETILNRLQSLGSKLAEQTGSDQTSASLPFSTVKADVENYLLNSYPWHLNRETLQYEFRNVIYDPEADPGTVRRQVQQLNRGYFTQLLNQREDMTPSRVTELADALEAVRQDVLTQVQVVDSTETSENLRRRVENYLRTTGKLDLTSEGIERDFKPLLEDSEAESDVLRTRLSQFDRDSLFQLLNQRQDLSESEANQIAGYLESTRDRTLTDSDQIQDRARSEATAQKLKLESYLRNTQKDELNPEGIKRDLRTLLDDPQAGTAALRARLSHFDRDTFVQLLNQRQDLSETEINQLIDKLEGNWYNTLHAPQRLAGKAKEQYDQTTQTLAEYLRNTDRAELNPEGIQRDLSLLLDDPKTGVSALRSRLSQVDRETLVQLLSQREDLSEEQVNQIIDQFQDAIRQIVRAPRRWALRTQTQVRDFEAGLESYLRNTQKDELSPEGIKRDLQLLVRDPRLGAENLSDRFSRFDRSTFVALLSQRQDMTEEEANRIADQIESTRSQIVEQVRDVQRRIQRVIDGVFARIRNYLNSLERPELNYDGIKRDVRKLFDDPQAGFDSLRDRLSDVDRGTLVALMSSREDVSEADANRVIDQIEGARNTVLQRAERLQHEAQRRVESVKVEAQRQAEETRKAAAIAAWWLFGTASISAAAAAIAGVLAGGGF